MSLEKLEWLLREDMNLNVLKVGVSERFMPEKLLDSKLGKVDLGRAVWSELCSINRQTKNYRHRLLAVKETME